MNPGLGRANQLNPQLLERFRQFSLESGILPENIAILPQNGKPTPQPKYIHYITVKPSQYQSTIHSHCFTCAFSPR